MQNLVKNYLGLLIGIATLIGTYYNAELFEVSDNYYEEDQSTEDEIRFEEVASQIGVIYNHIGKAPLQLHLTNQTFLNLVSGVAPSISVVDINNDGYQDIYLTTPLLNEKNLLYINHNGEYFKEQAEEYGLANLNKKQISAISQFADLNNDGSYDLILARYGCHEIYLQKNNKFHLLEKSLNNYCSNSKGFAVFDYNRDQILDFYITNYFPDVDMYQRLPPWKHHLPGGDDVYGGQNILFKGNGDGTFSRSDDLKSDYKSHTFYPGVGDFNNDGWPELYVGNDRTFDRFYVNQKGKFIEKTDEFIPRHLHGFAAMNSDVFDYDKDGWLDFYVTNIYGPPYSRKGNLLWKGGPNGFTDVSEELGVRKCGWSWGSKFIDFNNDGVEEFLVVNGNVRGENIKKATQGEMFWFKRSQIENSPEALKKMLGFVNIPENMNYFGYQRPCLFKKVGQTYKDVAQSSGIINYENARALATIDFNNDGLMDFITGNYNAPLMFFKNKSNSQNRWLGVSLIKANGIPDIGARIKAFSSKKLIFFREVYPGNGHRGQNDPRFVITYEENKIPDLLEIRWSDGSFEEIKDFNLRSYNKIIKSTKAGKI